MENGRERLSERHCKLIWFVMMKARKKSSQRGRLAMVDIYIPRLLDHENEPLDSAKSDIAHAGAFSIVQSNILGLNGVTGSGTRIAMDISPVYQ